MALLCLLGGGEYSVVPSGSLEGIQGEGVRWVLLLEIFTGMGWGWGKRQLSIPRYSQGALWV